MFSHPYHQPSVRQGLEEEPVKCCQCHSSLPQDNCVKSVNTRRGVSKACFDIPVFPQPNHPSESLFIYAVTTVSRGGTYRDHRCVTSVLND